MGVEVAVGAAIIGGVGQMIAGQQAADAQGRIAQAQLGQQRADRNLALQYAEPSAMEIAQLERAIQLNEQDVTRKQRLLDSSDPALIEAGAQALNLLRGEEAKILSPLRRQQEKDREKLKDRLRAQLGTGFENTSAGIQALAAFDEAAQNAQFAAQEQSLARLLGVAQDTSARYGMQTNIANASALSSQRGAINSRQVSAIQGTPITGAGAQYVSDLQGARNIGQTFGQIASIGTLAGLYGGGLGGGSPTSAGSNSYDLGQNYTLGNYNFG